jgi:hypothetical protein
MSDKIIEFAFQFLLGVSGLTLGTALYFWVRSWSESRRLYRAGYDTMIMFLRMGGDAAPIAGFARMVINARRDGAPYEKGQLAAYKEFHK